VVMMYVRYPLSLRNVEDLLFERGIDICQRRCGCGGTVRPDVRREIRRRRVQRMRAYTHWKWHLDEVYVKINGEMRYLWRAVDHEARCWNPLSPRERDKAAALKFIKKA